MIESDDVSRLLERIHQGHARAKDEFFARLLKELHVLADWHMRGQSREHTLQPTALIHEAYLRLFKGDPSFLDRTHFLRAASRAMRCVLVDHARAKRRAKREADGVRVPLEELAMSYEERAEDLVGLDEALHELSAIDPRLVEVVELRFFGGRTQQEVAEILDVSERTVERDWRIARAWLRKELG